MTHVFEGILSWPRMERVSDRYGSIMLIREQPVDYGADEDHGGSVPFPHELVGKRGRLIARVTGQRQSGHIGDFFRGLAPPQGGTEVGTELVLGEGTAFVEDTSDGYHCLGLSPDEHRPSDWLDPVVLYRLHEQDVELRFEETPECLA